MFYHPETVLVLASETRRALIAEADRGRLLKSARRARRARRAELAHRTGRHPTQAGTPAGTLAPCAPTAVPAR